MNSLLYKFETDIAELIKMYFDNSFKYKGTYYSSEDWNKKSKNRKLLMDNFMGNEADSTYYDYDFVSKKRQRIVSATNRYPLWAK